MCHIMKYDRKAFLDMSLSDIVNLIQQFEKANKEQYNHANRNKQNTLKGETEFYGVSPETLARWEQENNL